MVKTCGSEPVHLIDQKVIWQQEDHLLALIACHPSSTTSCCKEEMLLTSLTFLKTSKSLRSAPLRSDPKLAEAGVDLSRLDYHFAGLGLLRID